MGFRLTALAEEDVINIYGNGLALFGVEAAEAYQEGLELTLQMLSENPRAARERSEILPPVRVYPYRSHLVVYSITGTDILVVRILHGHQDWQSELG